MTERIELESGQVLTQVHAAGTCYLPDACAIHNPSDHHMRDFPRYWRSDWGVGFMERTCPHGIGHPDPDHLAVLKLLKIDGFDVHGCDGCCHPNRPKYGAQLSLLDLINESYNPQNGSND